MLPTPLEKAALSPPCPPKIEPSSSPMVEELPMAGSGSSNGGIVSILWEVGGVRNNGMVARELPLGPAR